MRKVTKRVLALSLLGLLAFTTLQYVAISNGQWPPGGCCFSGDRPGWSDWSYLRLRGGIAERLLGPIQGAMVQPLESLLRANWMRMYERRGRYLQSLVAWQDSGQSSRSAKLRWDITFAVVNSLIWMVLAAGVVGAGRRIRRRRSSVALKSTAA